MTKFRPITQQELAQRVCRAIPEVNPEYVAKTLTEAYGAPYDLSDVPYWVQHFENVLYGKDSKKKGA